MKYQIKKRYLFLCILFFSIIMFFVIPNIIMPKIQFKVEKNMYTIYDLIQNISAAVLNEVQVDESQIKPYYLEGEKCTIPIKVKKQEQQTYYAIYKIDGVEKQKKEIADIDKVEITFEKEGENDCEIEIVKNEQIIYTWNKKIMFIKKYQKQFLDEFNQNGIIIHLMLKNHDIDKKIQLLENLNIKNVRVEVRWENIGGLKAKQYHFATYDFWFEKFKQHSIKPLIILGAPNSYFGEDGKISTQEELDNYLKYAQAVITQYPEVENYEIFNEPNIRYKSEEDIKWYVEAVKGVKAIDKSKKIVGGATVLTESEKFLKEISQKGAYAVASKYSFHLYGWQKENSILNQKYNTYLTSHKKLQNQIGGFFPFDITETGFSSSLVENINEQEQGYYLVQQTNLRNEYGIQNSYIYNFRNTANNQENMENNFGLVNYDYTPKPSYYAIKNYCENTNGAEYIGKVELAKEVEAHVYNKDGKPKIIVWTNNKHKSVQIPYENFIAKDIYGKEIENTNGMLTIKTAPIYLEELDSKYFYQAISKRTIEKYEEFEGSFEKEIKQVPNLSIKIQQLKQKMDEIGKLSTFDQTTAIQKMQEHYDLGNIMIQAYQEKQLDIEYVNLSSMLDMLNDIGNSFENLVTVSAKTRNVNLEQTDQKIKETEELIKNNPDLEMVYPEKILNISKDYYEKSYYINQLEEENGIKTGLIVSKNLHSYLLANWANLFANLYIDKYIQDNPVMITYSQTNLTNQDVIATIQTNAKIEVTNNENSREYTFKENGIFAFEYVIKGRKLKIEAKVENIDKTPPIIEGVENNKVYIKKVLPKISDPNLKKVELFLNGQAVENYQTNSEVKGEGEYQITAIDKVDNRTTIYFYIIENKQEDYKIEGNTIKNIASSTKKTDFSEKLNLKVDYEIYRGDQKLENGDVIATGDILETKAKEKYTLIVVGDINKDGEVNIKDIVKMRKYLLERNTLDEVEVLAADTNLDNDSINIKDLVRMRIMALTKDLILTNYTNVIQM